MQQSQDRPLTVILEGKKEAPDKEIKSGEIKRESANRLEAKSSASHPQAVQLDGGSKVPDKSAQGGNITRDIPTSYGGNGKTVAPQSSSETISSSSSTPAQKPDTYRTTEKPSVTQTTTGKPAVQHIPTEKPSVQHIPSEKSTVKHIPTETPSVQHIPSEKSTVKHIPTEAPSVQYILTEKPTVQHDQTEKSSALHPSTDKTTVKHIPTEQPTVQHFPTEKPSAPHISREKPTVQHIPTEQPTVQHIPTEQPSVQHAPAEKPGSSGSQEPPLAVMHPETTSQAARVSDLREDKLELTVPENVAGVLSHSERSDSADVTPVLSQVPEDGTKQDTYVEQQQEEAEGPQQKAQPTSREPVSAIHSAGKVPKEASVFTDKSAPRVSETRKNDSRTSASKHKKVTCLLLLQSVMWHC
jgi:hypothetical protein